MRLSIKDLRVYYQTKRGYLKAVDGINIEIKENESIGLAGESGSGKSTVGLTLMRSLPRNAKVFSGNIFFNDVDILALSEDEFNKEFRWKKIAMVFQNAMNSLDPVYSIRSQLLEIVRYHRYEGDHLKRIDEVIKEVGLDSSVLDRYPHELSGGMKQRVIIASALLLNPELLIADEPTTALDVLIQAQILNLLKRLKSKGMNILLITHDLAIISEIAEKVAIMYAGDIVEFNRSSEIYTNPKHPYTQGLISSIPRLKSKSKVLSYIKGSIPDLVNPPNGCRFYARCPYAMDICKKDPPTIYLGDGYVKCWLYK